MTSGTKAQVLAGLALVLAMAIALPNADGNIIWIFNDFFKPKKASFDVVSARINGLNGGNIESVYENGTIVVFAGWAADFKEKKPARSVQVFLGNENVGVAKPSEGRPDVSAVLGVRNGDLFGFRVTVRAETAASLRIFSEMVDGTFAELKVNR